MKKYVMGVIRVNGCFDFFLRLCYYVRRYDRDRTAKSRKIRFR